MAVLKKEGTEEIVMRELNVKEIEEVNGGSIFFWAACKPKQWLQPEGEEWA